MNLYEFHSKPEELNGYEDRICYVPKLAFEALEENPNRPDKDKLENAITKNAKQSYMYSCYTLKGPFPKGEDAIAKDTKYSTWYAKYVLKGPFPKGEDTIAKDAWLSYEYAKEVLNGPFPKGEETLRNSRLWSGYQSFLKDLKK